MKNILVAINFEKNAERLVNKAEEFAKVFGAKVWILHVTEPDPDDFLSLEAGPQYAQEKRIANRKKEAVLVKELAEKLKKKNIDSEGLLIQGPTVKTIRKEVQNLDIDLVIAGHQKKNFFFQMFVGRMEQNILQDLKVPILIVPMESNQQ